MFTKVIKNQSKYRSLTATIALIIQSALFAPTAFAGIQSNTIDPAASIAQNGRHITATGPIGCTAGQHAHLQITVTQRSTGATAVGHTTIACNGYIQQWEIHASVQGRDSFGVGAAVAVALGRTSDHGHTDDAHQWLVNITLVPGGR